MAGRLPDTSKLNPVVAGFLRGLGLAIGSAIVSYGITYVGNIHSGDILPFTPIIALGLRTLEGIIDNARNAS